MREIKFRVYTEIKPEVLGMKYFDLSDTSERNDTVMQFTGLLDKFGKEIYEGDIVKDLMDNPAEVKFGKYSAGGLDYYASEAYGFYVQRRTKGEEVNGDTQTLGCYGEEVIGNIYESPQLLEHATN